MYKIASRQGVSTILTGGPCALHTKCGPDKPLQRDPHSVGTWKTMWTYSTCPHSVFPLVYKIASTQGVSTKWTGGPQKEKRSTQCRNFKHFGTYDTICPHSIFIFFAMLTNIVHPNLTELVRHLIFCTVSSTSIYINIRNQTLLCKKTYSTPLISSRIPFQAVVKKVM